MKKTKLYLSETEWRYIVHSLIGTTTTTSGLKVICVKDDNEYKIGIKVSDKDFAKINISKDEALPIWNYKISANI